jgi:hypothetical protein
MLYQSMSGDAELGHSSFTATGGSILANAGDLFYVTNTTCTISLENVALTLANNTLLTVSGNSNSRGWGTEGANGGICTFTASNQQLSGNIVVDGISSLDLSIDNGSVFTGTIKSKRRGRHSQHSTWQRTPHGCSTATATLPRLRGTSVRSFTTALACLSTARRSRRKNTGLTWRQGAECETSVLRAVCLFAFCSKCERK